MNADDAAGLPVAYLTAWYGLHDLAGLRAGERVLIHAAAGGVGLAAVRIARRAGAIVYATAGSEAKRAFLREEGVEHVFDSRSTVFADQVLAATDGAGIDVVMNSLSGEFIGASFAALRRGGRFLELGKRDIWSADRVAAERPDVGYQVYDLGAAAEADPALMPPLHAALADALADGTLRPLPVTRFPLAAVGEAVRFMAQARHIGKIVLHVANDAEGSALTVRADATYWITGGLGAIGIETAAWLAGKGARHLVLSGRRPPGRAVAAIIRELERQGLSVTVITGDIGDKSSVERTLQTIARDMPPLRGIVHAAGALADGVLSEQRWPAAGVPLQGKAHGALILDALTRDLPLDLFILYSAAGSLLGASGQGLYPAANAELDMLANRRRRAGLPALSVAWGLWGDGGMADGGAQAIWAARGLKPLDAQAGFAGLERLIASGVACGAVLPIDWRRFLAQLPPGGDRAFFGDFAPVPARGSADAPARAAPGPIERLRALVPSARIDAIGQFVRDSALSVMGLDPATMLDRSASLREAGLDSLMAVELRNLLVRAGGQSLPATLLFDHPSIDALAGFLMGRWNLEEEQDKAPAEPVSTDGADLDDLSGEELEALLAEELATGAGGRA